jgi:non-canonical purine NTP pyrophosphatase (RdgB/HAM1 family)
MKQLLFASSNKSKLEQFQFVADSYGYTVKIVSVYEAFPDIKPYDEEYATQYEIVDNGVREVYGHTKQPIIVEDTILEVDALHNQPGLHANAYLKEKGRTGLLDNLRNETNRSARITSIVGYYDGKLFLSSKNIVEGKIASQESYKLGEPTWVGPTHHPFGGGFNSIFINSASRKTIADHSAKDGLVYGYREPNFKAILDLLS